MEEICVKTGLKFASAVKKRHSQEELATRLICIELISAGRKGQTNLT
jgi:hypothetical protein